VPNVGLSGVAVPNIVGDTRWLHVAELLQAGRADCCQSARPDGPITVRPEQAAPPHRKTSMKLVSLTVAAFLLLASTPNSARSQAPGVALRDSSFRAFLSRFEAGTSGFINGDAELWKQNASRRDDATLMGGWGTYAKGWSQVGSRYDFAAARFKKSGATVKVEYLAADVSGDLAYTVAIERSEAHVVGEEKPAPMVLRVTHVFRKEQGGWKLMHRHADALVDTTTPESVLKK
jgi:ketosteroid isomerase-like protein